MHKAALALAAFAMIGAATTAFSQSGEAPPATRTQMKVVPVDDMAAMFRRSWADSHQPNARMSVPLYGGIIEFAVPRNWVPALQLRNDHDFVMFFIPEDEVFPDWTQALVVQSGRGLGVRPDRSAAAIAETVFKPPTCEGDPVWNPAGMRTVGEGSEAFVARTGCAAVKQTPGQGQAVTLAFFQTDKGGSALLRMQRFPADKAPADRGIDGALAEMGEIVFCTEPTGDRCSGIFARDAARQALTAPGIGRSTPPPDQEEGPSE